MKTVDIMESLVDSIMQRIFEEWKHEGLICGWSSGHINFEVDNKEYVLLIQEIKSGQDFSEFRVVSDREGDGE